MSDAPVTADPESEADLEADLALDSDPEDEFDDDAPDGEGEAGDDDGEDAGEDADEDDDQDDDGPDGNRLEGGAAREMLEFLAASIVEDEESVHIEVEEGRRGLTLRLHVAPDDMGRVIGRKGRVAQSIRTVVRAAAAREGTEVSVDIAD